MRSLSETVEPSFDTNGSSTAKRTRPRVLMLGLGWFPATLGGLDRYYRSLFEQLPDARGVVVGPAGDAPAAIAIVVDGERPLVQRLLGYRRAAIAAARETDVVDAHFALYAAAPLLASRALREHPCVFHFQGPWAQESVSAGDASRWRRALRMALERRVLHRADAHVVLSSAFRRVLVERYRVAPWGVHVWAPGVALEEFTPGDDPGERAAARERLGIAEDAFLAVCVRRLVPRMGLDTLLDAWEEFGAAPPGGSASVDHARSDVLPPGSQLLIVGDGALRERLAARAASPSLAERVRLLGRLSDAELIDAYRAADVAVVPTTSFEGFGLVVLEAAACGTPSIVTDVGGLPEVTMPLDRSLVVEPGDAAALGARLREAARGTLPGREQTRAYAERFSWSDVGERHRRLYRGLLAGERDPRTRVVFLDHVARLSGGEIALLRVLPHLQRVNAHVILGEDGPLAARLQAAGVSVEVLPIAASARDLRRDTVRPGGAPPAVALHTLAYVARLTRRLRQLQPQLVHTNSLKAGVYGSLAARAAGVPLLWHARDRIAADYIPRPAVMLVRGLVRQLADGVLANSAATLATLAGAERGQPRLVIPDSVELPPRTRAPGSRATVFGMLGRIAPWKGQDLFLRAFAEAFPAGGQRAVIVGTPMFGEHDYERELHELVARLGLTERVELRGFREDIWSELASFDALVHASVIPEPFGMVVLEGMAAGLAVIAPDEGGPSEVLDDGRTGRLFASRDQRSLATAMRELSEDPIARERLGEAARSAVADYRPEAIAARIENFYEEVLRDRLRPDGGAGSGGTDGVH
ncbi:MAG TPA: glycosyltransferase [Solirubrobacteraceae bacterium]|jgi:glycosyltransferase involved in cell wall biosynthesis|nr:glycosyltransferase [Solirubrobacteraceae bacterium]